MVDYNNHTAWATGGSHPTTLGDEWISYEFAKPAARQAINGDHPFIIKKLYFKTCAAPKRGQKMYARISTPDGKAYDNSYIGNTISWQQQAKVTYGFSAINFHWTDHDGPTLRAWLVSGGPFYYDYVSGGGTIKRPNGKTVSGTPVGGYDWAQVALPPNKFTPVRNATDSNRVDFTWDLIPLSNTSMTGGSTSLSGYCIQMAEDADFTQKVRTAYVAKGKASVYGLYDGYDWYFRIGTRNEVSEHYKLPVGVWGHTMKLAASHGTTPTPASDLGVTGGTPGDPSGSGNSGGSGGSTGGNNGGSTGSSQPPTNQAIIDAAKQVVTLTAKVKSQYTNIGPAITAAKASPTKANLSVLQKVVLVPATTAKMLVTLSPTAKEPAANAIAWSKVVTAISAADKALTAALGTSKSSVITAGISAASAAQAAIAAALKLPTPIPSAIYPPTSGGGSGSGSGSGGSTGGSTPPPVDTQLLLELAQLKTAVATLQATSSAAQGATTDANLTKLNTAALVVNTAATTLANKAAASEYSDAEAAWSLVANDADRITADIELAKISDAPSDTAVVWAAVAVVLKDVTAAQAAQAKAGDSSAGTGSVSSGNYSSAEGTEVFTPIPPTPRFHTPFGGLLLSSASPAAGEHTVYLMDRGGATRLASFGPLTTLRYNRIRDAQSTATITLSGDNVVKSAAAIDLLDTGQGVNRYELCIFRGDERVWEGPVTLLTIGRNTVTIDATDITHWLARTAMHGAYSNAYPNIAYVVDRLGGIIANELSRKEALDPPVNILKYVHTYIEDGDATTTRVTDAGSMTVWAHLDDLAAKGGIDYTVVGRALHIWDTSRPALGRLRTVTEDDFIGDTTITVYGKEQATIQFVSDGQGSFGVAGAIDPFYGEIELVATAYDENGNSVAADLKSPVDVHLATISQAQLDDQAERNLTGRNPVPRALHVPDSSGFRLDRGIGLDVLIPGVYVPVSATLAGGRQMNQMLKLTEVVVSVDNTGEHVTVTLAPAAATGDDLTQES